MRGGSSTETGVEGKMRCLCISCEFNSIHDEYRPKGFCEIDYQVDLDVNGKCRSFIQVRYEHEIEG